MEVVLVKPHQFAVVPWKNEGGTTNELLTHHDGDTSDWVWRLSIAGVPTDGPFSDFDGYDRTLILLSGNGIALRHEPEGTDVELRTPFEHTSFRGESLTTARLLDGPIEDFNLISRRDRCSVNVNVSDQGDLDLGIKGDELLVYALDGDVHLSALGDYTAQVERGCLTRLERPTAGTWKIAGGTAIVVEITYR